MRLLILGATGRTGVQVLPQALDGGHQVTALARSPEKLGSRDPRIEVTKGDVLDLGSLKEAMIGKDAVLAALTSGTRSFKPTTFFTEGARNIVSAMEANGVKRLVYVSSGGVERSDPVHGLVMRVLVLPLLRYVYDDMRRTEEYLATTGIEWTVVRAPYLTDGPLTGKYRIAEKLAPPKGTKLSRADLAHFMLEALDSKYVHKLSSIAY